MSENLLVTLPNGEVKEQIHVKIKDVINSLPLFMQIAVGFENGWYVQTTDTHPETYLSYSIVEGLETKEKAMSIAKNISHFTGMNLIEW